MTNEVQEIEQAADELRRQTYNNVDAIIKKAATDHTFSHKALQVVLLSYVSEMSLDQFITDLENRNLYQRKSNGKDN